MSERLYLFHKSQGWVLEPCFNDHRIKGVTDDGVEIWIIDRKPEPGERYLAREWDEYDYLGSYDEANLMEWKNYIADSVSLHECKRRTSNRYDQEYTFVTILQIED